MGYAGDGRGSRDQLAGGGRVAAGRCSAEADAVAGRLAARRRRARGDRLLCRARVRDRRAGDTDLRQQLRGVRLRRRGRHQRLRPLSVRIRSGFRGTCEPRGRAGRARDGARDRGDLVAACGLCGDVHASARHARHWWGRVGHVHGFGDGAASAHHEQGSTRSRGERVPGRVPVRWRDWASGWRTGRRDIDSGPVLRLRWHPGVGDGRCVDLPAAAGAHVIRPGRYLRPGR